jgi:hypothetical protein
MAVSVWCVQSRSGNILQHLASELRRAEATGGLERLVSGGSGQVPGRGATYPVSSQMRRRQSDPDFMAQILSSGGSQR